MTIKRRCKCGCGQWTNIGKKWLCGHHKGNLKHGLSRHKLYGVLHSMKQRCYNKNHIAYKNYGGRGVRVCIRWRRSLKAFYSWAIDTGWNKNLRINRINNDGNYTPDNCNFVTHRENCLNQRKRRDNISGYRGVHFQKDKNKYVVRINRKFLGYYKTAKKAAKERERYIIENKLPYQLNFNFNFKKD